MCRLQGLHLTLNTTKVSNLFTAQKHTYKPLDTGVRYLSTWFTPQLQQVFSTCHNASGLALLGKQCFTCISSIPTMNGLPWQ